jgi:hypothetical protein
VVLAVGLADARSRRGLSFMIHLSALCADLLLGALDLRAPCLG